MAKKEISIVLKAKNDMQVGLAKAKDSLQSFGSSILNIGKVIAGAFLAAGTAITGFAVKALTAYSESENATVKLRTVFRSFGESVDMNVEKIKKLSSAIEEQTGIDDLALQSRAAQLKMMGVQTNQLEQALKATIAAERAGMAEEQSIRAVAQAMQGNLEAFNKYIPALQNAQLETEKLQILNDFLTITYADQMATVDTVQGRWMQFKDAIGDVFVKFGEAIAENGMVQQGLQIATEKVQLFGETIGQYIKSDAFINLIANVRLFGVEANKNFMMVSNTVHGNIAVLYDFAEVLLYIPKVAYRALQSLAGGFVYVGELIGAVAAKIASPFSEFIPPDTSRLMAAFESLKNTALDVNAFTLDKAMEAQVGRIAIEEEYAVKVNEISEWQLNALADNNSRRIQNERQTGQAIVAINVDTNNKVNATAQNTSQQIINNAYNREQIETNMLNNVLQSNTNTSAAVGNAWKSTYQAIGDAAETNATRAINSAKAVQAAVSNTGFNVGLTGRTFEIGTGGGGADVQQALENLRRRGFAIGGMPGFGGQRVAELSDIVAELQKIRQQNDSLMRLA